MVRTNRVVAAIVAATFLALLALAVYARLLRTEPPAAGQFPDPSLKIIEPLDLLQIRASGTFLDEPIDGFYLVEPSGQVALGPAYGRVDVSGSTCEQAERKIAKHLKTIVTAGNADLDRKLAVAAAAKDDWQEAEEVHKSDANVVSHDDVQKKLQRWKEKEADAKKAKQWIRPEVQVTAARRGGPWREAVLPQTPYTIGAGDVLNVRAIGTLLDQPINGDSFGRTGRTLALGREYGRVQVRGYDDLTRPKRRLRRS